MEGIGQRADGRGGAALLLAVALCVLGPFLGCGGDRAGNTEAVTVTGTVEAVVPSSVSVPTLARDFTVVAVDEAGEVIGGDTTADDQFSLYLPTGHDYVIVFRAATPNGVTLAVLTAADGGERAMVALDREAPETVDLGQVAFVWPSLFLGDSGPAVPVMAVSEHSLARAVNAAGGTPTYVDHDGDLIPDTMDRDDDNDGIDDAHDAEPLTYEPHAIDYVACSTAQANGGLTVYDGNGFIATELEVGLRSVVAMQALFDQLGMTEFSQLVNSSEAFSELGAGPPTNADLGQIPISTQSLADDVQHLDAYSVAQLTRATTGTLRAFAGVLGYVDRTEFSSLTSQPNYQIANPINDSGQSGWGTAGSTDASQAEEYYRSIARVLRSFGIGSIDDPDDPAAADSAISQIQDFLDPESYATTEEFLAAYGALLDDLDVCVAYSEVPSRWAGLMATTSGQ